MLEFKHFNEVPVNGVIYFEIKEGKKAHIKLDAETCRPLRIDYDKRTCVVEGPVHHFSKPKDVAVWHFTRGRYANKGETAVIPAALTKE